MDLSGLKNIVQEIIVSQSLSAQISAVKRLSQFYRAATADTEIFNITAGNEATLKGGQALSSYHAAACTDDYVRTAVFIKGIYNAIVTLQAAFPQKRINILYAGCGPYATLLLPLLTLFGKESIAAILLDINEPSVNAVNNLIPVIGLSDYTITVVEADAITYTKPAGWDIDLLIAETMHYALTSEPQVAIIRNLSRQLLPHSIMIPQEINISLGFSFFAKEPFLKAEIDTEAGRAAMQPYPFRSVQDTIFSVGKELFGNVAKNNSIIESPLYTLPRDYGNCSDVCLYTELVIFRDIALKTAESYITNPYCVASIPNFAGYRSFRLVYDFSNTPRWEFIPVS